MNLPAQAIVNACERGIKNNDPMNDDTYRRGYANGQIDAFNLILALARPMVEPEAKAGAKS